MRIENNFSREFMEGFVEKCQAMGLDCEQTEDLFRKHANNSLLSEPAIFQGFQEYLAKYDGPMRKSAIARWLTPAMISLAEDCRIKWGSDALSQQMRAQAGMPEPSWDTVPDYIKEASAGLSNALANFDYLPMNQKVLMAALLGGGVGATVRAFHPSQEDKFYNRGFGNRLARGAGRGALAGTGAAVGRDIGGQMVWQSGLPEPMILPAEVLGGGLGGLAGYKLGEMA